MAPAPEKRRASLRERAPAVFLFLLAALLTGGSCVNGSGSAQEPATKAKRAERRAGTNDGASKETSRAPVAGAARDARAADRELARAVERLIDESELKSARWGVHVVSLRDRRTVYARDADRLFTPASNMKLYTTAAALDLLGANYRWRTSVYAAAAPGPEGTVAGDLVLYGRGDPGLSGSGGAGVTDLDALADNLYRRGVRRVRGSVVGDESYFRGEALGDGWLWQDVQWYFGAEPSALSVDGNQVKLMVAPAAKAGEPADTRLLPQTGYVQVVNDMLTTERGARPTIGVTRALSSNSVRVWGEIPLGARGLEVRLSVHAPALWAARQFREALRARGVEVEGEARAVDSRTPNAGRLDHARAVELAFVESRTLAEVVRRTNKESLNLEAELILRTLGRERGQQAPDPDPERQRLRNTDEAGLAVVRLWLEERAGARTVGLALRDGSGLSQLNLVTPETTTRLLARMNESPAAEPFRASLPVAGRDGTLRGRLRGEAAGRVAAKTGSLTYVDALSGYVTTAEGEGFAFSIICNEEATKKPATQLIDAITRLLASYPSVESAKD